MTRQQLIQLIQQSKSYLCVGLDTDLNKIPTHLKKYADPVFEFNKQIIDATRDLCIAYKPNIAFYEAYGSKGWQSLEKTIAYIGDTHFKIADAKRGDIGNTSARYADAFFQQMQFDAITVAPYMGEDSVIPFLQYENKFVILLALTSNKGSKDFQFMQCAERNGQFLFERVIQKAITWGTADNLMFVIGATHPEYFQTARQLAPDHFFLVPGVGAQGGDVKPISEYGKTKDCGLIVNSTREIIYAGNEEDFAEKARAKALEIKIQMEAILST